MDPDLNHFKIDYVSIAYLNEFSMRILVFQSMIFIFLKFSRVNVLHNSLKQCCGPGSGIRCLFDPWIRIRVPE